MFPPRSETFSPRAFVSLVAACVLCLSVAASSTSAQTNAPKQTDNKTRGIELYQRGDYDGALKTLRAATKEQKDDAETWYYFGLVLVKKQKLKDAQKALETATKLHPQFPAALSALAYTYLLSGRPDLAGQPAARAVELEPTNAEAHYLLAVISYRFDALTRALEETEAALKYDATNEAAMFLQSQVLVGMAGRALREAYDETPDVRAVLTAKANERLTIAAASLEKFLQRNPNSNDATLLKEEMKTLRFYSDLANKPASDRIVLSSKEVTSRAIIISKPEPAFTQQARQNNTTGEVVLRIVLGADGTVQYILPVKTLPDGLTQQCIAAARRIKFIPATKDGRPVAQFVTVAYNFNIY